MPPHSLALAAGAMILTTAAAGDTERALSSVFIIAQSDNKNREYLVSWLQKISLKQLFFE